MPSLTLYCVCVSAKGPVFSSGHDLKELTSTQGREYHTKVFHTCAEVSVFVCFFFLPYELRIQFPFTTESNCFYDCWFMYLHFFN